MTIDEIRERLAQVSEPEWVRLMKEHYFRTGKFRAEDLRRLLGDPQRGVELGPRESMTKNLLIR